MWNPLRRRPTERASEPEREIPLNLAEIPGALVEAEGFPRPQWPIILAWLKAHFDSPDYPFAVRGAVSFWLALLQQILGGTYGVYQSKNFFLLTSKEERPAQFILQNAEQTGQHLVAWLGPAAEKRGYSPHVILDFATEESYYTYIAPFHSEGDYAGSGGIFLRSQGYQHIALAPSRQILPLLVHELTHNRLAHLPLPLWLNEGIAMTMEDRITSRRRKDLDRELYRRHSEHWTPATIETFWCGHSFSDPTEDFSSLSYSLAHVLVDLLVNEYPEFPDFVAHAQYLDAGESAARQYLNLSLGDVVATFLGEGSWAPAKPPQPPR